MDRNYDSISPSALSLLKMKGRTAIPFAKEAAALLEKHGVTTLPENQNEQFYYWMRVFHFEARYASINNLLKDIQPANILELSSGYSFRGLDYCIIHDAHYIDTDLPEVVELKQKLQNELAAGHSAVKGKLETIPLNALDEAEFDKIAARFGDGALTIVNEGLLMYLNTDEKKKLCSIIHKHLLQKNGYWITADIYVKSPESKVRNLKMSTEEEAFFTKHNIDENKFESEDAAEDFFKSQGLIIDKVANVDFTSLSSFNQLLQYVPEEAKRENKPMPKIQATWRLKAIQQ
jgi:O-methyltransferase involved in polyketide biosynthesis